MMMVMVMTHVLVTAEARPGSLPDNRTRFDDVQCSVDDDGRHEVLDKCLKLGHRFIRKYIKALSQGDGSLSVCESSAKYLSCMVPLLERCPGMKHVIHHHWRNLTTLLRCVCHEKNTECTKSLDCLADEYQSLLIARCNSLFHFNIRQNTRDHCYFLREAINCKDALITSRCGDVTGQFAYHLLRLSYDDFVVRNRCHLPRNPSYKGFRYTDNNGQCFEFLSEMRICVRENISRKQMLSFREDNDLIIKERHTKRQIKEACSRYRKYENCMKPIQERCPAGPNLVYEIDPELRNYRQKMEYICKTARKRYLPHVRCYNRIHTDGTLKQCNEHVWDDVATYLDNLTSYQVYCDQELPTVMALKQELGKVRLCYEEVVTNECNHTASQTLSDLMEIVFSDPVYLHLEFVADCELHRPPPPGSSTSTASTNTGQKHHKHRTKSPPFSVITTTTTTRKTTTTTTTFARRGRLSSTGYHVTKSPSAQAPEWTADPRRSTSGSGRPWPCLLTLIGGLSVAMIT